MEHSLSTVYATKNLIKGKINPVLTLALLSYKVIQTLSPSFLPYNQENIFKLELSVLAQLRRFEHQSNPNLNNVLVQRMEKYNV